MACNLAVVSTDDKTRRYVIEKAGLYISRSANALKYLNTLEIDINQNRSEIPMQQAIKFSCEEIVSN